MPETLEFRLLVLNQEQSLEVPFTQQITVGRDVINALALRDSEASRSHAIVYATQENGGAAPLAVKDLDSLNGIYVNGVRVKQSPLRPGDELIVGSTIILVSPDPNQEIEESLSEKGLGIFRGIKSLKPIRAAAVTSFSMEELEGIANREFENLENSAIWMPKNAAVLIRAAATLAEANSPADFFPAVLQAARELVQSDEGVVMLRRSPREDALEIQALVSTEDARTMVIDQNVIRIVMRGAKAFYTPEVEADDRFPNFNKGERKRDTHSLLAVPFCPNAKPVGFLYLDSRNPTFSYDRWALILLSFLTRCAVALANAKGFFPKV